MPRKVYNDFIKRHSIHNTLGDIPELSYTKKFSILSDLQVIYPVDVINRALNDYRVNYIDLKRVDLSRVKNTLVYYCNIYKGD